MKYYISLLLLSGLSNLSAMNRAKTDLPETMRLIEQIKKTLPKTKKVPRRTLIKPIKKSVITPKPIIIKKKPHITHQGLLNLLSAVDILANKEITQLKNNITKKLHTLDAQKLEPFFNTLSTWMKIFTNVNQRIIKLTKSDSRATFMHNLQNFAHKQTMLTPENYTILLTAYSDQPEELKKQIKGLANAHGMISNKIKASLKKLDTLLSTT